MTDATPVHRLAIFDLDGTLLESQRRGFVDAVARLCADFRYPVTRRALHLLLSSEDMFGFAAPEDRDWLERVFWDRYAPRRRTERPVPGAVGALRRLRASGVRIAVATARHCSDADLRGVLVAVGLAPLIDDALAAGVDRRVDKPALMHRLCAHAMCAPHAAFAVGDTSADVRAARDARIGLVIAVRSGHIQRRVLQASGPDLVVHSVADLPMWIPELRVAARATKTTGARGGPSDG